MEQVKKALHQADILEQDFNTAQLDGEVAVSFRRQPRTDVYPLLQKLCIERKSQVANKAFIPFSAYKKL